MNAIQSFSGQGGMTGVNGQQGPRNQHDAAKNELIKRLILQGAMGAKNGGTCGGGGGTCGSCGGATAFDDTPPGINPADWAKLSPQEKEQVRAGIAQAKGQGSAMNMCACGLGGSTCQK